MSDRNDTFGYSCVKIDSIHIKQWMNNVKKAFRVNITYLNGTLKLHSTNNWLDQIFWRG